MRVELIQLLRERQLVHPSRIVSAALEGRELRIAVEGHIWWRNTPAPAEGKINFSFSTVTGSGQLEALFDSGDDEALETFDVSATSELPWAQPDAYSIYCSSRLPDALAVFTAVQDYLLAERAPRIPGDFLNAGSQLSQFLKITASACYLLATGPDSICKIVRSELDRQSVPYTVLAANGHAESPLFVRLGGLTFFCDSAVAEFDE